VFHNNRNREKTVMILALRPHGVIRRWIVLGALLALVAPAALTGQVHPLHQEGYLTPPPEIAELVEAPRHENVLLTNLGPDARFFLNSESEGMPALAGLAKHYVRLAGLPLDPEANRSRNLTARGSAGFDLIDWRTGRTIDIQTPRNATVSGARWSPDGRRIAFLANLPNETHVYVADVSNGRSTQVTRSPLLATRVTSIEWAGDSRHIFAVVVPNGRDGEPRREALLSTPIIRVTAPQENRLRTYASLLKDPYDAALLEHYSTGQLVRIDVQTRRAQPIGEPAMIESINAAPLGDYVQVRTTRKPFSYIVPASMFGNVDEVWDLSGRRLVELEKRDLREGASDQGDDEEDADAPRRFLTWRPDGQGLSYVQRDPAPDTADAAQADTAQADTADQPLGTEARARPARRMDRVFQWLPPFDDDSPVEVYASSGQIRSLRYSPDMQWLFITERTRTTERLYAVHLSDPETRHTVYEWDTEEFYENPGSLMNTSNHLGASVVRFSTDGEHVFLSGTRYFEDPEQDAPRPFIDRVAIRTGEKERIFESSPDLFERVTAIIDDDLNQLVIAREGPNTIADSWLLDRSTGALRQLTSNVDPHPVITNARRERFTVTRADGFKFNVNVTLPADYVQGTRLPAMFWFYPREVRDQESYDRGLRTHNKNRFPTAAPRSLEFLTVRGYAVVQPDHPIVGPSSRINANFMSDLRQNHLAVIDALDERGWIDRRRLALGGHSYGGFGTINAMVHTPFFRAGIAGAPNSNRLLTPIGFQGERQALWDARETYLEMSPFLWAERLTGALLIYHGEDDQNVGTAPDNSWRLIHALNGLGKTAALYMYPYEDHGQVARETLLDMWARWTLWLDHYVKNADVNEPVKPIPAVAEEPIAEGAQRR
jgi:dipeptidyl aminopeptidase/acylaminoacyl peptidase